MVVNKRYTSLRAVGFGLLVNILDKINIETSEHAFLGKTDVSDTVEIRWYGVYIDVSQKNTRHDARENI